MRYHRQYKSKRSFIVVVAFCLAAPVVNAGKQRSELPVAVELGLLLKALTYDYHFSSRYPDGMRLGVLSYRDVPQSRKVAGEILQIAGGQRKLMIVGAEISAFEIPLSDATTLEDLIKSRRINTLYLCPHLDGLVSSIITLASKHRIPTLTGVREYVEQGAALGAVIKGKHPKLIINLRASKAQGAEFKAKLLALAEIIR
jgi:hypothetical protein